MFYVFICWPLPIQLAAILAIGALVRYNMVQSLFVKV